MQAYVSLWSADLLDVGRAIDLVEDVTDGFHLDVFDGHNVDELLFGPDFAAAVRDRTSKPIDIHLNVTDPDRWVERFADTGADMITVQAGPCPDVSATLHRIRERGLQASLGVEVHEDVHAAATLAADVDRFLVMGTAIGVKGAGLDERAPDRVKELRSSTAGPRTHAGERPLVFVDGGIRATTVAALAAAGADGVIPGSLVFAANDPVGAIRRLHQLDPDRTS